MNAWMSKIQKKTHCFGYSKSRNCERTGGQFRVPRKMITALLIVSPSFRNFISQFLDTANDQRITLRVLYSHFQLFDTKYEKFRESKENARETVEI